MRKALEEKVSARIALLRNVWPRVRNKHPFVAFSTGKDSLALAAMLYEAVEPETPTCLYVHHDLEFASNLDYLKQLISRGFSVEVVRPFLEYFDLMERGIGFLTLRDPWCVPMLIGTGLLEWLQMKGARGPKEAVMFRGMSRSEYSHRLHSDVELYRRLDMPCVNPLLDFTRDEILEVITNRYGLPLNPIYEHMDRTYCICCYTSDKRRQEYSSTHYPSVCDRYYRYIERMLFDSGLVERSGLDAKYRTKEEKLCRHGFVHWHRSKSQDIVGAAKRRLASGAISYGIREAAWISTKHLRPLDGHWVLRGKEIRFWDVAEDEADTVVKRMINCMECGFCVVECFPCRHFNRDTKKLEIHGCINCGKCLRLKFCMGWRHRFWRRVIYDTDT